MFKVITGEGAEVGEFGTIDEALEAIRIAGAKDTVDVNEDLYNECESHPLDCACDVCTKLNNIGGWLAIRKHHKRYEVEREEIDHRPKHDTLAIEEFTNKFNEINKQFALGEMSAIDFKVEFVDIASSLMVGLGKVSKGQTEMEVN